jgi:hypothetical protein
VKEAGDGAVNLSAKSVVAALAVDGVVNLPVTANVWTVLERNVVVAALAAGNVAANDVAVPGVRIVMRQEAGECVTGGE